MWSSAENVGFVRYGWNGFVLHDTGMRCWVRTVRLGSGFTPQRAKPLFCSASRQIGFVFSFELLAYWLCFVRLRWVAWAARLGSFGTGAIASFGCSGCRVRGSIPSVPVAECSPLRKACDALLTGSHWQQADFFTPEPVTVRRAGILARAEAERPRFCAPKPGVNLRRSGKERDTNPTRFRRRPSGRDSRASSRGAVPLPSRR